MADLVAHRPAAGTPRLDHSRDACLPVLLERLYQSTALSAFANTVHLTRWFASTPGNGQNQLVIINGGICRGDNSCINGLFLFTTFIIIMGQ